MRTLSNSLMVLLMVAALFFGNCFSCPQMLLASMPHQPQHNCCPGQQPVSARCQTQGIQHFVKTDSGAHLIILAVAADLIESPASIVLPNAAVIIPAASGHAPPGILSLRI